MSVPSPGPDGSAGGLPVGGTTGQVLTKESNADGDADWENAGGGGLPAGGSIGQTIINTGPGAGTWQNAPAAAPLAHAPSHESGGSDPITNLGFPNGAGDLALFLNEAGLSVGTAITEADPYTLAAFRLTNGGAGEGYLRLQTADQLGYFDLAMGTESLDWTRTDGSSMYVGAGTAFYLYDELANPYVEIEATALTLNHYDAAGTGTLLSSLVLADPGLTASSFDAAAILRSKQWSLVDGDGGWWRTHSFDAAANLLSQINAGPFGVTIFGGDTTTNTDWGYVEVSDSGVWLGGTGTGAAIGVLGATPYGQDAYIDPTTITPEQLANYQIARGWMAAA